MAVIGAILADQLISASADFVIGDWIASAGEYILDVTHSLDSQKVIAMVWENSKDIVGLDRIEILNDNNIRLHITNDPDCRFDGRVIIFRTQG